jgi:hypothetical protein
MTRRERVGLNSPFVRFPAVLVIVALFCAYLFRLLDLDHGAWQIAGIALYVTALACTPVFIYAVVLNEREKRLSRKEL